ncbi:MAG TPA: hypothetical protein VFC79_05450, partial [Tissierellaceae bacterium]|nr:hypothetical protein [Tissierellaceae bacterium]
IKSNQDRESENINLDNLDIQLKDTDESQGALRCDNHYFKFIYNLELRNAERSKNSVYVGIISIDKLGYRQLSEERLKDAMNPLLDIVYHKLRKGDVLTQWNDSQVLLLLYDLEEKYIEPVIKRVKDGFKEIIKDESIILNIKFKKI